MKKFLFIALCAVLFSTAFIGCRNASTSPRRAIDGGVYVRYNYLGFTPSRQKRLIVMSERNLNGREWTITKEETETVVMRGRYGSSVSGVSGHMPLPFNYVVDFSTLREEGTYRFQTEGAEDAVFPIANDPYSWLVSKPILWMRTARCGYDGHKTHGVCHLQDSNGILFHRRGADNGTWHDAGSGKTRDMTGGWHDAGDYVKFTLTIGYATYFLLRSYELYPALFDTMFNYSKSEFNDLLDEAKWGVDWLYKTMDPSDTTEFVVQVANYVDHNVGYRLAHNDTLSGHRRPILSALSPTQMGYASASLALAANIFRNIAGREDLAAKYEERARLIFRRAISDDAVAPAGYDDKLNTWYGDQTINDNLALAAAELFRLTGEDFYREKSVHYQNIARSAGWRAWESVNMPANLRVMEWHPVAINDMHADLDAFMAHGRRPGNIWGLPIQYVWAGLYSYIAIGANALEFQMQTGDRRYEELGRNMFDYMMGKNNWGINFVATQDPRLAGRTITQPNSQTFGLQAHFFPEGAISEGPGDRPSWERFSIYFPFDPTMERTYKFNTSDGVFFDNRKDFMCMETTIHGVSDGIFKLTTAIKFFSQESAE